MENNQNGSADTRYGTYKQKMFQDSNTSTQKHFNYFSNTDKINSSEVQSTT